MSNLEEDYRRTVSGEVQSRFLPGTSIEIIREAPPGRRFRHVLFDFDGTLSLIREGWPEDGADDDGRDPRHRHARSARGNLPPLP
jgi:hypothetical protein